MKTYIGTKIINAMLMTRASYNAMRGWVLPANENGDDEGYLVEYTDGGKPNHPDFAGYVSWSPKEQFEKAYKETKSVTRSYVCGVTCSTGSKECNGYCKDQKIKSPSTYEIALFDFGAAINALKMGKRVTRIGWNGAGLWLEYVAPQHDCDLPYIRMSYPVNSKAYPAGARVPWLASQTDMLADDWSIV